MLLTIVDEFAPYSVNQLRTNAISLLAPGLLEIVDPGSQALAVPIFEVHLVDICKFLLQTSELVLQFQDHTRMQVAKPSIDGPARFAGLECCLEWISHRIFLHYELFVSFENVHFQRGSAYRELL